MPLTETGGAQSCAPGVQKCATAKPAPGHRIQNTVDDLTPLERLSPTPQPTGHEACLGFAMPSLECHSWVEPKARLVKFSPAQRSPQEGLSGAPPRQPPRPAKHHAQHSWLQMHVTRSLTIYYHYALGRAWTGLVHLPLEQCSSRQLQPLHINMRPALQNSLRQKNPRMHTPQDSHIPGLNE